MPDPYDRGSSSRRRGGLSHWAPLLLTVTIATVGVAAWVWNQRNHEDDDEYDDENEANKTASGSRPYGAGDLDYDHADYGENPPYGATSRRGSSSSSTGTSSHSSSGDNKRTRSSHLAPGSVVGSIAGSSTAPAPIRLTDVTSAAEAASGSAGWGSRMSDALSSTGSPQQWMGSASKAVSAGVAAASAAVGGALASIREGDKDAYADHETWSEEADARKSGRSTAATRGNSNNRKRKTVVLVVSADSKLDGLDGDEFQENTSILSYIPRHNDFSQTRIFVLIYAPNLKDSAATLDPTASASAAPGSLSSSFSNIGADQAQSPKLSKAPAPDNDSTRASTAATTVATTAATATSATATTSITGSPTSDAAFTAVHAQAQSLVEKDGDIIPFTTASGHAHILRLLAPEVVYLQESLTGENGSIIKQLQTWLSHDIVVVVGTDNGHGGLADSESEVEKPGTDVVPKWWQREDRVGRGRGVVVVDSLRINDDWIRRVQGQE